MYQYNQGLQILMVCTYLFVIFGSNIQCTVLRRHISAFIYNRKSIEGMAKFIYKIKCICLDILSTWAYIPRCTELPEYFFFTLLFSFLTPPYDVQSWGCLSTFSNMIKKSWTVPNLGVIVFTHTRIFRDIRLWEMRLSYISRYTKYISRFITYISRYTNMGRLSRGSDFQLHLETWSWPPGWKPHFCIYIDILSIYRDIRNPHFSYSYISVYTSMSKSHDTQVGHSLWLFYDVWIRAQATPMTDGGVKNEKKVWRKRILVTQYIYIYTAMYWVYQCIYLVFAKVRPPKFCHAFWLLIIVYECTDTSPKHSCHSTLYFWAESEKKICSDHEYLQPLIIRIRTLIYSYILVHTGIYAYILVHTIRLEPPCHDVLSLLHACAVHCSQHPSFLRSLRWSDLPGGACQTQTATATGSPHRHCCPAVRPLEPHLHSHTGSLNPCACWTCEELLEYKNCLRLLRNSILSTPRFADDCHPRS